MAYDDVTQPQSEMKFFSYPKIETLYVRDLTTHKVLPDKIRQEEFLIPQTWHVTEKIDGMNVRIMLGRDGSVAYGGRTDAAQLPASIVQWLIQNMWPDKVRAAFDPDTSALLFGEGYGERIQKGGGDYRPGVAVRLFDVVVFGAEDAERHHHPKAWWLNWAAVEDVAKKLGVETVPVLAHAVSLDDAVQFVGLSEGIPSSVSLKETATNVRAQEGIVARTEPILFTRTGARLCWKLKAKDW